MVRNPFATALAISILLITFLWILDASAEKKLARVTSDYHQTKEMVEKIGLLKKEWENSGATRGRIDGFIASTKDLNPKISTKGKSTKIEISGASLEVVKRLSSEILISPVIVKSIEIKRRSANSVDLMIEVSQ